MRVVAVDWSGARAPAVQRRAIWTACAEDGRLRSLVADRTRGETVDAVLEELDRGAELAGFDFSFSLPAWYLHRLGVADGPALWALVAAEGEGWLARCQPPFWGRPGRPRPPMVDADEWRRTERATPAGRRRPKSSFQIGGAGAVGTASLRGMPHLRRIRAAGVAVWPFDPAGTGPAVAEVYPRWWTGPVVKSRASARAGHLTGLADALPRRLRAVAEGSEDAFDAACTAIGLSEGGWSLPAGDAVDRIEGRILLPGGAEPDDRSA